jgi:crossover junction endodeoxyribonuclease RuvC
MMILGIDPGAKGGMCLMDDDEKICHLMKTPETECDIKDQIRELAAIARSDGHEVKALIEQVSAMPGQGVTSMFTFGRGYGFMRGVLISLAIPILEVHPKTWQKPLGVQPRNKEEKKKAFKNRLKAKAQQLFPGFKMTDAVCDAALIAKYGVMATKQGLI